MFRKPTKEDHPPTQHASADNAERDKIIRRLRCLVNSTFTSSNGVEGKICWNGLYCIEKRLFVPYHGNDPKTKLPWCPTDCLRDVIRDNEKHISYADDISIQEFLKTADNETLEKYYRLIKDPRNRRNMEELSRKSKDKKDSAKSIGDIVKNSLPLPEINIDDVPF